MPGTMRAREEAPPALSCNIDAHAKQLIVETLILHRIGRRSSRDKTDDERAGHDKPRLAHPMNHGFPRGDLTYFFAALPLSQHRAALTSNLAVIVSHWSSLMRSTIGKRMRLRHLGPGARATARPSALTAPDQGLIPSPRANGRCGALSSAGEHTLHTGGVVGSIPTAPTIPPCRRHRRNFIAESQFFAGHSSPALEIAQNRHDFPGTR